MTGHRASSMPLVLLAALVGLVGVIAFRLSQSPSSSDPPTLLPFHKSEADYYRLDDQAGHLHQPHATKKIDLGEHPQGVVVLSTNNLGFREDETTEIAKSGHTMRILVSGDSHIDGIVYNRESFPNRLEQLLNSGSGSQTFEVINGGTAYYGPQNYLGFLRRFLFLDPDLYVVVIFTGNDYMDAIKGALVAGQIRIPERPPAYLDRLQRAKTLGSGPIDQGLNQTYFFKTFPRLKQTALDVTGRQIDQISELCAKNEIELVVITLPSLLDVAYDSDAQRLGQITSVLELTQEDLSINRTMTTSLVSWLERHGIEHLDAQQPMERSERPLFWRTDYHLNDHGHRLLAEAFYESYGQRLEQAASAERAERSDYTRHPADGTSLTESYGLRPLPGKRDGGITGHVFPPLRAEASEQPRHTFSARRRWR